MNRYDAEEMILTMADIVVENRQLKQEVKRLSKVEKEYYSYIAEQCRESARRYEMLLLDPSAQILCRCNCKRHRRCADNHPGTSGRLYQSAFRNRKKSGSPVTHRQKRAASDTGKACAGCLLVVGRNGICRNPSKIKTGRSIHLCIQSERRSNELPAGWELFHLQQPCRKQYPSVHHWPEELAVFREPQGRRSECRNLYVD